jgi:hypothetical protein
MKKYSSSYLHSLSIQNYLRLMAKELDDNGFRKEWIDGTTTYSHFAENMIKAENAIRGGQGNPTYSFVQTLDYPAIKLLIDLGILNNGRCPICGAHTSGAQYLWTARNDTRREFHICKGCMHTRGGGTGQGNGMPGGCASLFLLLLALSIVLVGSIGYGIFSLFA